MPHNYYNLYRYQQSPSSLYLYFCHRCCYFISFPAISEGDTIGNSALALPIGLGQLDGSCAVSFINHICVGLSCGLPLPFDLAVADWSCGGVSGMD